mmetsp:Transcript_33048/g.93254  ORF Transcript_33048/g.93254 Transcript_33048/m.93254 type:complete len:201 (-) Transcript_33048:42-644(-)
MVEHLRLALGQHDDGPRWPLATLQGLRSVIAQSPATPEGQIDIPSAADDATWGRNQDIVEDEHLLVIESSRRNKLERGHLSGSSNLPRRSRGHCSCSSRHGWSTVCPFRSVQMHRGHQGQLQNRSGIQRGAGRISARGGCDDCFAGARETHKCLVQRGLSGLPLERAEGQHRQQNTQGSQRSVRGASAAEIPQAATIGAA